MLGVWAALGCASASATAGSQTAAPGDEPETAQERRQERQEARREAREQRRRPRTLGEKVAGRATEGAINEALETLDTDESRQRMQRIIASPAMQEAAREITASVVAGVFDGVDAARSDGHLPQMPDAGKIGRSLGRTLDRDITPATGRLVHHTIDSALDAAMSERNTGRMEALVHRIGTGMIKGLADAVRDELGPALAITLERDILPALGRGLQSPDVQEAIVKSMASLGVGAARGTQAGLAEADINTGGRRSVGGTLAVGLVVTIVAAVSFAILFIVMTVLLVRSNRRQREMMEQARRREERFLAVLEGRADTHGEPITSPGVVG